MHAPVTFLGADRVGARQQEQRGRAAQVRVEQLRRADVVRCRRVVERLHVVSGRTPGLIKCLCKNI